MLSPEDEKRAIQLLQSEYVGGGCAFICSRDHAPGKTCAEERPPGCLWCDIGIFLKKIGQLPKRR